MDYFTLFGMPITYSIDLKELTYRYQELQRKYHPDCFVNQPQNKRLVALQHSMVINTAYQALKHPLKRAEYILILNNIDIDSEQYSTMHDTDFLMQQFLLHEELASIETSKQINDSLLSFFSGLNKKIKGYLQEVKKQLDDGEWMKAVSVVHKLRFLDNLQKQAEELEERLLNYF